MLERWLRTMRGRTAPHAAHVELLECYDEIIRELSEREAVEQNPTEKATLGARVAYLQLMRARET